MQSIGWDAHLEREWNRHTDAQDEYSLGQRLDEIEEELWQLEEARYEAEEDGRAADAAAIDLQIEELQQELDNIKWR